MSGGHEHPTPDHESGAHEKAEGVSPAVSAIIKGVGDRIHHLFKTITTPIKAFAKGLFQTIFNTEDPKNAYNFGGGHSAPAHDKSHEHPPATA